MSAEARYLGYTTEQLLDAAKKSDPTTIELVVRLRSLENSINETIVEKREEAYERFSALAQATGLDPKITYQESELNLRWTRLKETIPYLGKRLSRDMENEEVLKIWDEVILSLGNEDQEAVVAAFEAAIPKIDALDPGCTVNGTLKRTIDAMRSELAAKLTRETVLDFARYKVGREGVDERRDHIGSIIETIHEAMTVRDELLDVEEKAITDAAIEDAAGLAIENEYRIDWQGSRADCVTLMKFLLKNGYIKASKPNQYIAKHFSFRGELTTAEALGKLKTERDANFTDLPEYLKIPVQKK